MTVTRSAADKEAMRLRREASAAEAKERIADSVRPDGTWSCVIDRRTTPCGECGGCRDIQALNRAERRTP